MGGQGVGAFHGVGAFEGGEKIEVGHLGIHDDETFAGQPDDEVGLLVLGLRLFGEVAMGAHAGGFHDAAQGFLTPAATGLIGVQHEAELLGFLRQRGALLGEEFELLFDFAEGGGLGGRTLLQIALIIIELLFERFNQTFDRFLPLGEVAFGGFLKFAKALLGEAEEFGGGLFQGVGAEGFERVAEVGEGFFLGGLGVGLGLGIQFFLAGEHFFGGGLVGLGGGKGGLALGQLVAGAGEVGIALGELLAEFGFEAGIGVGGGRGGSGRLAGAEQPADDKPGAGAEGERDEQLNEVWHVDGSEMGDDFNFHVRALGQRGHLDGGAGREIFGEIFGVHFVHAGEVGQVGHEDGAFHDVAEGEALVVQDGFDVLEDAFGLGFDVAGHEGAIRRIQRDLAGGEQEVADADGVVVGADGGG